MRTLVEQALASAVAQMDDFEEVVIVGLINSDSENVKVFVSGSSQDTETNLAMLGAASTIA